MSMSELGIIEGKTKQCTVCKKIKSLDEFHQRKASKDGKRYDCKDCSSSYTKQLTASGYKKGVYKRARVRKSQWAENFAKCKATKHEYEELLKVQNGVCAICGRTETARGQNGELKRLAVDHCHKTGKVRGLLCFNCNAALGKFKDSPVLLAKAITYLS
jgi:hypothetical protein